VNGKYVGMTSLRGFFHRLRRMGSESGFAWAMAGANKEYSKVLRI
jgi:hypothetical protein